MSFVDLIRADLKTVFLTDFAETVVWTAVGGSPVSIQGIFIKEQEDVEVVRSLGLSVNSSNPHLLAAVDDVPNIGNSDTIVVRSVTYRVKEPKPEETGLVVIELTRSNAR